MDLLIKNAQAVVPNPQKKYGHALETVDIAVSNGRITRIAHSIHDSASTVLNAKGLHLLPGVIDSQVHFREPGLEHKEDLATGTRGALKGGVTAIFEMPNTKPSTTSIEAFNDKLNRAANRSWCHYAFFIGASGDNTPLLNELELLPGCAGVKVFMGSSTGQLLVESDADLERILQNGRRRVAIHSEDEQRLRERRPLAESSGQVSFHPQWRDEETAVRATTRLLRLAEKTKRPVHVLHVTTGEEMILLSEARKGANVTVECTPQHLTLSAPTCYDRLGTLAQMNPPIRDERHRQALWRAIHNGVVDVIGSDHAPHTLEEKMQPYPSSPSGMTGVQTLVPIMLNHVRQQMLSLEHLVNLICVNPAKVYGLKNKGALQVGGDADFTFVDLKRSEKITNDWIESRSKWSPFDGVTVQGWPVGAVLNGHVAMWECEILGGAKGQMCQFG